MTRNARLKARIRQRAEKTGESYTAARRHLVEPDPAKVREPVRLTVAVAQTVLRPDPRSVAQLRESGSRVRDLVADAAAQGAALVLFPEGALTSPAKGLMSRTGPEVIGEADWSGVDRQVLADEVAGVARLARERATTVVVGGIAFDDGAARPANSLFVLPGDGTPPARYDERMLSRTKSTLMYRPGSRPLVVEVGGVRFGCTMAMESHYPELFAEYERADVDGVLLGTHGNAELPEVFAIEAAGHAAANSFWVAYAGPVGGPPSGLVTPSGSWQVRCADPAAESVIIGEIDTGAQRFAREWRRTARAAVGPR
jgi:predicted amidohydrolase